jgi:hypothetical protein
LQKVTSPYRTDVPPEVTVARKVTGEPDETDGEDKEREVVVEVVVAINAGELILKDTKTSKHLLIPLVIEFEFEITGGRGLQLGGNSISGLQNVAKVKGFMKQIFAFTNFESY